MYRLKIYLCTITLLCCLLPVSPVALFENCNKCTFLPPDCQQDQDPPSTGGPPCACTPAYQPKGCTLKPCDLVETDDICDCTLSTGPIKSVGHEHRLLCYKFQCTGKNGECESCTEMMPPECTPESYSNPPIAGGPECSCDLEMTPGGCTLQPCINGSRTPDPCTPRDEISEHSTFSWYATTCHGKWSGVIINGIKLERKKSTGRRLAWTGAVMVLLAGGIVASIVVWLLKTKRRMPVDHVSAAGTILIPLMCCLLPGILFFIKGLWILFHNV